MILSFLNSYIINLAIIVATILSMYFFSLNNLLRYTKKESDFLTVTTKIKLSLKIELLLGLFIGFMCFFISMNRIPIDNIRPVDVRYLPVYFSVYYGTPITGLIAAITLILFKSVEFFVIGASYTEYINNFSVTLIIFLISFFLYQKKLTSKKAILTCLTFILLVHSLFVSIFFFKEINQKLLIHLGIHFLVFSSLFLLTGWLINNAILISERIRIYRTSSIFDSLTSIYNKDAFYFFLDLVFRESVDKHHKFSLALIDFDNFKQINDTYGHLIGDKVLKEVTYSLKYHAKNYPLLRIFRIGGDELAILYKEENIPPDYFEKINTSLSSLDIKKGFDNNLLTLSVGLIHFVPENRPDSVNTIQDIFNLADSALYEAKRSGKNQVVEKTSYLATKINKKNL